MSPATAESSVPTESPAITEIDAATLKQWLDRGEAVLIDVREPDECARERLAAATSHPLSKLDPVVLAQAGGGQKRLVLHCKGGRRSMEAANRVVQAAPCRIFSLKGGLEGWKAAGLPVVTDIKAPLPIMRQVQITVGASVLIASILAAVVSPWFLLLTGFFGAGLLFAGATGQCALATTLAAMPWNRIASSAATGASKVSATATNKHRCCGDGSCGG